MTLPLPIKLHELSESQCRRCKCDDAEGKLKIDDPERHRLTGGITLSLGTAKLQSDIRLNYEQYFYKKDIVPSISEQNKIVLGLIVHF